MTNINSLYPNRRNSDDVVWDDLLGSLVARRLETTTGRLQYNFENNSIIMQNGGDPTKKADRLIFNYQVPHRMLLGVPGTSEFRLHLHWEQETSNKIEFQVDYRIQNNGSAKITAWTTVLSDSDNDSIFPYVGGTMNQLTRLATVDLSGADVNLSSTVQFRVTRTDVTTGDVQAVFVDAHFPIYSLGSREEFSA